MLALIARNVRTSLRNTSIVIWAFLFPLIMATIFMTMFSNFSSSQYASDIPLGVVADARWNAATGLRELVEGLAGEGAAAHSSEETRAVESDASEKDSPLFALTRYATADDARAAVLAGDVAAYLAVDAAGKPVLYVSPADSGTTSQAIIQLVLDRYLQGEELAANLAEHDPAALASSESAASFARNLADSRAGTVELDILREPPQEMSRYYYALLGYSCIMCTDVAKTLIERTRSGASALGDRCQVSATPPSRQLVAAIAASWLIVMASMLVTIAFLWLVAGVSFGGRVWLTPVACAACALVSCAFGAFIGSLPGANPRVKDALVTICTLALSLPAGLFGEPAVELGNWLTRNMPLLQLINPATQATDAFFALTFYDSLAPFGQALAALVGIAAVLALGAALCMRRTRHAHC
ncbi:ABC transporter permease [Collinsella sp. An2]|uniref:ABC transporter permease n=1 Tax=Collinsella sp. An2 TaxID=1965585 RepID=UPI000B398ACD|nr:ABC transporter permease [Collinsella sp. An2]OUP09540.1 hypothetical protein B5F33_05110 [Collinsella sp. An2]